MTAPLPLTESIQIGGQVQQWPDGTHKVVTMIGNGSCSFQFAMPPDAADTAAGSLAEMYTALAAEARRADTGLVVPNHAAPKGLITP